VGLFNVAWSSAIVLATWAMAYVLESNPLAAVLAMGLVHLACIPLVLLWLPAIPGEHPHGAHAAPPVYHRLLAVFRVQLPMSYLVLCALSPYLPTITRELGLELGASALVASVWLAARAATFALLQRWHGWHGRWATAYVGCALLLSGFASAVLSPPIARISDPAVGTTALILGLLVFGAGMGTIYCSALYYAMEVGSAEVQAGGTHEALIGAGYMGGPLCLLAANWAVGWSRSSAPAEPPVSLNALTVLLVSCIALGLTAWSIRTSRRAAAAPRPPDLPVAAHSSP
jgi:hypothetical protein